MSGLEGADWSLLEATQESLREHMAICKELQRQILSKDQAIEKLINDWNVRAGITAEYGLLSSGAITQCAYELRRALLENDNE